MRPTHSLALLAGHSVVKTADSMRESSISLEKCKQYYSVKLLSTMF